MEIDFGKTAEDYRKYRAGFPDILYDRLFSFGIGRAGDRVLDLGTGTGTLGRGFALRGCDVIGLDPSRPLLEQARAIDREANVKTRYVSGRAENTGFAPRRFDVVGAGQCWHWFDRDRAAVETRRILVDRGWLVIAHFDWIPLPGNVAEATEHLIEHHNPDWKFAGGTGLHPRWLRDVAIGGFRQIETFSLDLDVPYTHEAWRGRIRASAGVSASLGAERVAEFDRDLERILREQFPGDSLAVLHRLFAVVCRAP